MKGRLLGIIEAKKVGVGPAGVLEQAKRCARGAEDGSGNWRGYRALFLVDRRALAAQAVREFAAFNTPKGLKFDQECDVFSQRFRREDFDDEKPYDPKVLPGSYLTAPQPTHTFVYVSTIQRMAVNLFGWEGAFAQTASDPDTEDEEAARLDIPIHAFDAIVADECHRGYTARDTATWRAVLDHFDAVKIGLTATPAAHTLSLFNEVAYASDAGVLSDHHRPFLS